MELRHLRYFVAVAEELHFGRAAARVGIAQPPLSQQIRRLEQEIGVELLRRNRRKVELTDAGAGFLSESRAILERADHAVDLARRIARGQAGRLVVGFVSSAAYGVLPGVVRMFRAQHPGVELVLQEMASDEQLQALAAGKIDLGLARPGEEVRGIRRLPLIREPLVAVLPEGHRLAKSARVKLADLSAEPWVMISPALAPVFHEQLIAACRAAGFTPAPAQETRTAETVVNLVAGGVGVSVVPESLRNLRRPGVVYRELRPPVPTSETAAICRDSEVPATVEAFLKLLSSAPKPVHIR